MGNWWITKDPSKIPQANWKTFTNEKYGYEVKYPPNWILQEEGETVQFLEPPAQSSFGRFGISIVDNPQNLTLDQWSNEYNLPLPNTPKTNLAKLVGDLTVHGNPAKKFTVFQFDSQRVEIFTMKDGVLILVSFDDYYPNDPNFNEHQKTYNQILSTFKFLEPQEKEVSWEAAVEILKNCEVKIVSQTHSLDVYLSLKDGSSIHTKEPRIDLIGEEIIKLREKCGEILYATE